jgi:hypothetical protein
VVVFSTDNNTTQQNGIKWDQRWCKLGVRLGVRLGLFGRGLVSFAWKWGEVVKGGKMKGEVR